MVYTVYSLHCLTAIAILELTALILIPACFISPSSYLWTLLFHLDSLLAQHTIFNETCIYCQQLTKPSLIYIISTVWLKPFDCEYLIDDVQVSACLGWQWLSTCTHRTHTYITFFSRLVLFSCHWQYFHNSASKYIINLGHWFYKMFDPIFHSHRHKWCLQWAGRQTGFNSLIICFTKDTAFQNLMQLFLYDSPKLISSSIYHCFSAFTISRVPRTSWSLTQTTSFYSQNGGTRRLFLTAAFFIAVI